MEKKDLKNGMVVEITREGIEKVLFLVLNERLIGEYEYWDINSFDENMKNTLLEDIYISKVYNIKKPYNLSEIFALEDLELIWEKEKEIDWNKVPEGTKVQVSDFRDDCDWVNRYFRSCNPKGFPFFTFEVWNRDKDKFTKKGFEGREQWKFCKIHPEVKIKEEWYK